MRDDASIRSPSMAAPASRTGPDRGRLRRWLLSDAVVSEAGTVRSWHNAQGGGYDYPEAAGLWLSSICPRNPEGRAADQADAVAAWLGGLVEATGGVGRDGRLYLFDSAVALAGLVAHSRAGGGCRHEGAMAGLFAFIAERVGERRAAIPTPDPPSRHWSLDYGAYQLKALVALHTYADLIGERAPRRLAERLLSDQIGHVDGARLRLSNGDELTYLHGSLYALEGLAYVTARGLADFSAILDPALDRLAAAQTSAGGLMAWLDGSRWCGPSRADAVAQAIRLWRLRGPDRWAPPVEAALGFLAGLQVPAGGIRYAPDSSDVNTWVSLFALQALDWCQGRADGSRLV